MNAIRISSLLSASIARQMTYRWAVFDDIGRQMVLAQKDLEIARCEAMYREPALEAASHLVARFTRDT